ncbi:hypothetical protein EAE32_06410 [Kocuria tytonicola]|uniref:Uncharacterized protein n=1 Tax=Kocuria tytonicola TaxID=2055946 RepID=A0A3L9LCK8_9MICC|nr:hypothetical protein [Kocuria tytonicola]RLY94767.1 hypothetical protein EAE32_06410 [Kocuria tytonicola]
MQTISELVKAQKAASDLSYEALAQRAQGAGLGLTKQQLSDLANNRPKGWPKSADMVKALSVALDVPERTVVLAYAASFGIDVRETRSPFEVRLPATVSTLDPMMQDAILHVIRAATEGASAHEHDAEDHEQEPRAEAGGAQPTQPSPMTRAGESPAAEDTAPPVPDEYALAAYDAPSEGRAMRSAQDQEAEASQDGGEWDPA